MKQVIAFVCLLTAALPLIVSGQETVKEPSTEKMFPREVKFQFAGKEYPVQVTGLTVRKKLFFKVYGIAHYMQDFQRTGNAEEAFKAVLTDGKAKQLTLDFARNVDAPKIKDAYTDGFRQHASPAELQQIQPLIDRFIGYFTKDVKENEQYIFRWIPGGSVVAIIQGQEKPVITSEVFARTLWSIWFGNGSIVDRDELVENMTGK